MKRTLQYLVRPACLLILAHIFFLAPVVARSPDLRDAKRFYELGDFDAVINWGETSGSSLTGRDRSDCIRLMAWSYYQQGRLLFAAHEAAAVFTILYHECLTRKGLSGSPMIPFFQMVAHGCLGELNEAVRFCREEDVRRLTPRWRSAALIWQGCLSEQLGRTADRDRAWGQVHWTPAAVREREAVRGVFGVFPDQRSVPDPGGPGAAYVALTLDPGRVLPRETKVRLLTAVPLGDTLAVDEKQNIFYGLTGFLAAGRLCLDVARDLWMELQKGGEGVDSTERFHLGWASFLLGDREGVRRALSGLPDCRSQAVLGAALYKQGETDEAKRLWQRVEAMGTQESRLWLGYVWARLGLSQNRAMEYVRDNRAANSLDVALLGGYVFDSMRRFDDAFEAYNAGYRYDRRSRFGRNDNSGELVIRLCAAAFRSSQNDMAFVNQQMYYLREKYPFLKALHELTTSLTSCRKDF